MADIKENIQSSNIKKIEDYENKLIDINNIKSVSVREVDKRESIILQNTRLRKSVVINYRSKTSQPYFIELRAVTFNEDITERGLLMVLNRYKNQFLLKLNVEGKDFYPQYVGYEQTKTALNEDRGLNNKDIYVIGKVKRSIVLREVVKV